MSVEVDMSRRQNANSSMGSDPMEAPCCHIRASGGCSGED